MYGQENLNGKKLNGFPLEIVAIGFPQNRNKGFRIDSVGGIAGKMPPLRAPIVKESYFPFLFGGIGVCRKSQRMVFDQMITHTLVPDCLQENFEALLVQGKNTLAKIGIEIACLETFKKYTP
jgi:hypothetical protein